MLLDKCDYTSSNYDASSVYKCSADLCDLQFADNSFDVVISFHVLEHIPDDRAALREIHRVLKPNGRLVLCLPETDGPTDNYDPGTPEKRFERYGHHDHRRQYGSDIPNLLMDHGFSVRTYSTSDLQDDVRSRLQLFKPDHIHVATK